MTTPAPTCDARRTRRRRRADPPTIAWPIGLVLLIVALGAWRVVDGNGGSATTSAAGVPLAPRTFGDARLEVPRSWHTLARTSERITWGSADRTHTVTLASTEASIASLPSIVHEVVAQSTDVLPGASRASEPVEIDLGARAPRGDSAVLVRFRIAAGRSRDAVEVVQVWRRDARAGIDVVATWTSADGRWPASPRELVPQASSNG